MGAEQINYEFIIDTKNYAGNFEREMTAYCTGVVGDCEIGIDEAQQFYLDRGIVNESANPFEQIVQQKVDEHGCYRPCTISSTPGRSNNGMGVTADVDSDEARSWRKQHVAHESVTIFFCKDPSQYISLLCERASDFAQERGITITGFRLIKEHVKVEREEVMKIPELARKVS